MFFFHKFAHFQHFFRAVCLIVIQDNGNNYLVFGIIFRGAFQKLASFLGPLFDGTKIPTVIDALKSNFYQFSGRWMWLIQA